MFRSPKHLDGILSHWTGWNHLGNEQEREDKAPLLGLGRFKIWRSGRGGRPTKGTEKECPVRMGVGRWKSVAQGKQCFKNEEEGGQLYEALQMLWITWGHGLGHLTYCHNWSQCQLLLLPCLISLLPCLHSLDPRHTFPKASLFPALSLPPPPRRISMLCHLTSWASLLLRETWSTTACLLPSPGTLMLQIHYLCAVCLPLKGQRLHLFCLLRGLSPMPRTVPGLTSPACKTLGLQLRSVSHLILQSLYRKNIIYINSNYRYFFFQFYWDIVDTLHRISVRCTT